MSKFDECYEVSGSIISSYIELIGSSLCCDSFSVQMMIINFIKNQVLREYEILQSMSLEDIDECLNGINYMQQKEDEVLIRVINKMINYKEILQGRDISSLELGITNVPRKIQFSIYDSILSMINIDVIKSLKNKVDLLSPTCEKDKRFVEIMYNKINGSRINFLFNTSLTEMMALYSDVSIDKISRIDVNMILNKIKIGMKNGGNAEDALGNVIAISAKKVITMLDNIGSYEDNYDDIFSCLVLITRIEVLISYMDRKTLNSVYNYCNFIINNENRIGIEKVKKLIKNKMNS